MKLDVIICAYNESIEKVAAVLKPFRPDVRYIISHQYTDKMYLKEYPALNRPDVSIYPLNGKGLSKNRNNGLKYASGDIVLIADDDVRYFNNSFDTIIETFKTQVDVDVALFKIKTLEGEPEYKPYPEYGYLYNNGRKHWVSSIEIVLRLSAVRNGNICFDERFGIGNKFIIAGEEHVFVDDCVKKGLRTVFFPQYIVEHPYESSVKKEDKLSNKRLITKGAIDARTLGGNAFWNNIKILLSTLKRMDFDKKPLRSFFYRSIGCFLLLVRK